MCDDKNHDEDCYPKTFGNRDVDGDGSYDAKCCNKAEDGKLDCGDDCDDTTYIRHPKQVEICDGIDNNCDGKVDEDTREVAWYPDNDDDGYGVKTDSPTQSCAPVKGYSIKDTDCDDSNAARHPGQIDICDQNDNDCDGNTDEDVPCKYAVSATIGTAGGEIGQYDKGRIVLGAAIPAGAVKQDTEIKLAEAPAPSSLPAGYAASGPTYEFSASGVDLGKEITVTLPVVAGSNENVAVLYASSDSSSEWKKAESVTIRNGVAEVKVSGGGYFQVVTVTTNRMDAGAAGAGGNEVASGGTGETGGSGVAGAPGTGGVGTGGSGGVGGTVGSGGSGGAGGTGGTESIGVYSYDFESGLGDWYADNGIWEVGTPTSGPNASHSGSNVAATVLGGDYPNSNSRMISPSIQIPSIEPGKEIRLRFWHWFVFDSYDSAVVQVSEETSVGHWSTWTSITTAYTGSGGTVWTYPLVDLSAYAGKKVRIGFYLQQGSFATVAAGWYIDDVSVQALN